MAELRVLFCTVLALLPLGSASASADLDVDALLSKRGVQFLAVVLFEGRCEECSNVLLEQAQRRLGSSLYTVAVVGGNCDKANLGWTPDKVICDSTNQLSKRLLQKRSGSASVLLWDWQGNLRLDGSSVTEAAEELEASFYLVFEVAVKDTSDGSADTMLDGVEHLVAPELKHYGKFIVDSSGWNFSALQRSTFSDVRKPNCKGQKITRHSWLEVGLAKTGGVTHLYLRLLPAFRRCYSLEVTTPWKEKSQEEVVRRAVSELMKKTKRRAQLPGTKRRGRDATAQEKSAPMVEVPAGRFWSGCRIRADKDCTQDDPKPKRVHVGSFSIDATEVTVARYTACMAAGRCTTPAAYERCNNSLRPNHPVNCVDWHQAATYCRWVGRRLPTDAEWEKAYRGTDGRKFPWGNTDFKSTPLANISDDELPNYDDGYAETAPVGRFKPDRSVYGAMDMMGNVAEWTQDWSTWLDTQHDFRTFRGGSFSDSPSYGRGAYINSVVPRKREAGIGFRCAASAP